jgi:hypothetical protein
MERWELAELRLDEPAAGGIWRRPSRVEVDGDTVLWSEGQGHVVRATRGTMLAFVGLAAASADRVGRFIERWGGLSLDAAPAGYWTVDPPGRLTDRRYSRHRPVWREAVHGYRREAARVAALLHCSSELYDGRVAPADRWAALRIPQTHMQPVPMPRPPSSSQAQRAVGWQASLLMRDYGARPALEPIMRDGRAFRPLIVSSRSGLAGALAYQVLVALARGEPFGWCDIEGCEQAGVRRSHARWYCEAHDNDKAKNANRQRRYRARRQGA